MPKDSFCAAKTGLRVSLLTCARNSKRTPQWLFRAETARKAYQTQRPSFPYESKLERLPRRGLRNPYQSGSARRVIERMIYSESKGPRLHFRTSLPSIKPS